MNPEYRGYRAALAGQWRYKNPEQAVRHRQKQMERRETVLAHYGGKCLCCGETERAFLQIDHIYGDGRRHRGVNIVAWLLKAGLPEGYRVLCANCNFAIARRAHCPHNPAIKTERKVIPLRASPP